MLGVKTKAKAGQELGEQTKHSTVSVTGLDVSDWVDG